MKKNIILLLTLATTFTFFGCTNQNFKSSNQIINAFETLELSLITSQEQINKTNELVGTRFEEAMSYSGLRGGTTWYKRYIAIQTVSDEFHDKIEVIKKRIIEENGGFDESGLKPLNPEKLLGNKSYFLKDYGKYGFELQLLIMNTRDSLLEYFKHPSIIEHSPEVFEKIINENKFNAFEFIDEKSATKKIWHQQFSDLPLISVITLLTKIQLDCKLFESQILIELARSIPLPDYYLKFNTLKAYVIAEKGCTKLGEYFTADVLLLPLFSSYSQNIFLEDQSPVPVENGAGKLKIYTTNKGINTVKGYVTGYSPDSEYQYQFTHDWQSCECDND